MSGANVGSEVLKRTIDELNKRIRHAKTTKREEEIIVAHTVIRLFDVIEESEGVTFLTLLRMLPHIKQVFNTVG